MKIIITTLCFIALALSPATPAGAVGDSGGQVPRPAGAESAAFASFNGTTIDLRVTWGTATACHTDGRTTQCYRSEREMDTALGVAGTPTGSAGLVRGPAAALAACSSSVRLYSGTSYTGSVLSFTTRFTFINLSTYGYDNVTSSYKVGACSSSFYDGVAGTGSVYPGNTSANVQYPSMVTGWNDRVSSIYIY